MSSSLVSGPYASAVSIKFTPSSTARLRTFSAFCRSGGQPQMPSPVTRIAPKPSRLTVKSPPKLNVGFVAMFDDVAVFAPRITSDFPARSAAPLARVIPTNLRRVTLAFSLRCEASSCMSAQRTSTQIAVNAGRLSRNDDFAVVKSDGCLSRRSLAVLTCLSLAHHDIECLFEIFSERHNAAFVPGHRENLAAPQFPACRTKWPATLLERDRDPPATKPSRDDE